MKLSADFNTSISLRPICERIYLYQWIGRLCAQRKQNEKKNTQASTVEPIEAHSKRWRRLIGDSDEMLDTPPKTSVRIDDVNVLRLGATPQSISAVSVVRTWNCDIFVGHELCSGRCVTVELILHITNFYGDDILRTPLDNWWIISTIYLFTFRWMNDNHTTINDNNNKSRLVTTRNTDNWIECNRQTEKQITNRKRLTRTKLNVRAFICERHCCDASRCVECATWYIHSLGHRYTNMRSVTFIFRRLSCT